MYVADEVKSKVDTLLNSLSPNMSDALEIEFESFELDSIKARMPVFRNTIQPFGYLHGGASAALAETLCSIGAWLNLADSSKTAVGLEINANHLRAIKTGYVQGIATPIKTGRSIHVWQTHIYSNNNDLISISRCTLAVVDKN